MFPFAPVSGPGGFPLPPGPGTVLARIEDAVRETANDVVETMTGSGRASGTKAVTVTSSSGAQGTATLQEHVVTVDEYNAGMESMAKRVAKLAGQVAQIRTGMLTQGGGQGWDGAMSWEQYQAQQSGGGGEMSTWMPLLMTMLLTKGNGANSGGSLDTTTLALLFMLPNMSNGGGGGSSMNMMMPILLMTLLKK